MIAILTIDCDISGMTNTAVWVARNAGVVAYVMFRDMNQHDDAIVMCEKLTIFQPNNFWCRFTCEPENR